MTDTADPLVFLDYTQEALDRAYDQTAWAPNMHALRQLYIERSADVRTRRDHKVVAYGPHADETLEVLPCGIEGAPIVLFIHGGRWLPQPENNFIHFADTILDRGAHFIGARFSTLTQEPGPVRLPMMVEQLRSAVAWLQRNAASFGGDAARVHLVGHSSGAHLAAVLLTTDWPARGLPQKVFATGSCISGIYDMEPVLLSARSKYVKLDPIEADDLSPARHVDRLHCPLLVSYGDRESPEFKRQAQTFAFAVKEARQPHMLLALEDSNHFEGLASLYDPHSVLSQALLQHTGLAGQTPAASGPLKR